MIVLGSFVNDAKLEVLYNALVVTKRS